MATWKESPNWTPFDEINGGQQFTNALTPEDLNALAENIAYLYENQGDEVIPDHTQSDFTLQLANTASGELGVVYSSTEKVSFEAAPSGEVIDTFVDTNFVPRNIKKDVEIFGVVGEYEGEGGGEVIPEFTEVEGFDVFLDEADEGTITVAYSTPQDVKLSAPSGSASAVRLASVDDENFIPSNIKSGVSIFGLTGAYEAEDKATPIEVSTEAEMTALLESGEVGGVYKYTGTTGTYENGALYVLENATITFTIDGTTYEAEDGMTWEQWVASDYNTDGYAAHPNLGTGTEDSKVPAKNQYCITYNSSVVSFGDLIIANASYGLRYETGGGGAN